MDGLVCSSVLVNSSDYHDIFTDPVWFKVMNLLEFSSFLNKKRTKRDEWERENIIMIIITQAKERET